MKLSKEYLKKLIKEELNKVLEEAADGAGLAAYELTGGGVFQHNGSHWKLEYKTGKGAGDIYTVMKGDDDYGRKGLAPVGEIYIDQFDKGRNVLEKIDALG